MAKAERGKLRIGMLRLTDAAPVIAAHELGFFADEGVETELLVEPSWANIADKLAYGFLDAAVMVPPLAFAVSLGLRGTAQALIVPFSVSLGGNTITLASALGQEVREAAAKGAKSFPQAFAEILSRGRDLPALAVVHAYSTHNLQLRYWLQSGGVAVDRDASFSVVPPALAVEALRGGRIAGFCAGAPWGEIAEREKVGTTIATSHDIWRNAPEKVLAVREDWATANPDTLSAALRGLLRAAQFCDAPENAAYTAALLSRRKYVAVDSHAILSSLPGGGAGARNVSVFHRYAATFPWLSHARWFLDQMKRWKLLDERADAAQMAARLYRPDLYRAALASLSISVPAHNTKIEGGHDGPWKLDASPAPIEMAADRFCDGAVFAFDD
jgi:NitT/TauT family transport system ATP-binding protein/nitrate/nitrite transport system substrate-binding protein